MTEIEKFQMNLQKPDRAELAWMLSELSDDALRYVVRPIVYAYYNADFRDPDRLTNDDSMRMSLISAAAFESEFVIRYLDMMRRVFEKIETARGEAAK